MCCYLGEQLRVEWLDCGSMLKSRVVEKKENAGGLSICLGGMPKKAFQTLKLLGRGVCRFDAYSTHVFRVSCLVRCGLTSNDELSSRSSL